MKKIAGTILLICASAGLAFGQTPMAPPAATAKAPSVSADVKQVEQDWTDAMKAGDTDKLSQILGDDWVGLGPDGARETKKTWLDEVKAGTFKMTSMDIGPMEVKVLGSVAVVQGSDTEKSMYKGKDTSGKYVWMDVFAKRDGKWVAVRSQIAQIK
jgi:ketosteroid isomerase-like protein